MKLLNYAPTDIDRKLAERSHYATSHFPERRAEGYINEYMAHFNALVAEFEGYATEDNEAEIAADLERYRQGYIKLLNNYLHSHSNVMSAFIVGPANFPTRRNEKRSRWADNHRDKWLAYCTKTQEKLRRKYNPRLIANAPISADDEDAIEKLQAKIDEAEKTQEFMKAANKIIRRKIDEEDKVKLLVELGVTVTSAHQLLVPDYMGRTGYPSFQLQNNNANIRRMKQRIEDLKRQQAAAPADDKEIEGVIVRENKDINRLQIIFPGKPEYEVRSALKSNGFRWSPREGAWQRQLTANAKWAASRVLGVEL